MIKGIKHIIFDLGGVILNINYSLTENAFKNLGITNFNDLFTQLKQTSLFDQLETGKISKRDFIIAMQQWSPVPITESQIIEAWNAMLLDFPLVRLSLLQQLRLHHDLFLLSNTNIIHEEAFNNILFNAHGMQSIGLFFDKVYYSHRLGLRKPNKDIFEYILNENNLKPENTLFIDDSPQHITTAKELNIQTIHLTNGMTIENDIFKKIN